MSWDEVPQKLERYAAEEYAPPGAKERLLSEFGAVVLADVPEHRREEFEDALNYRLGACVNLRTSKAWRPDRASKPR